tara:strand:- start:39 stop:407 length:369 start_codon:yes stop_codon:yes gene_type:complete
VNNEIEELLKQIKAYRNDMVARNYPFQQISDIITKWEMRKVKTVSENLQDELEPIDDFLDQAEKEKKELEESYQEAKRQTKERTTPLNSFSKDLKESIQKRTYKRRKEHATDMSFENESKRK